MSEIEMLLFQSFSDAMPLGACLIDLQGRIVFWNAAAEGITGYHSHEVLGRAYRQDLLINAAGKNKSESSNPVSEVLRDGRPITADLHLRHKLGHRLPVHLYAFPLRDAMGEIKGVGQILDPAQPTQESPSWIGHSDREFELATGLGAIEESRLKLKALLRSRAAATTAVILIELSELSALQKHGGTAMLHQAIRVLAKTIAGVLPARNHIGCWSDWRLLAIVPDCTTEMLEEVKTTLAGVGSTCAVKWWGDRVEIGMRSVARYANASQSADDLIQDLESELKSTYDRKA